MAQSTGKRPVVPAHPGPNGLAPVKAFGRVERTEARRGEREEDGGMLCHRRVDPFSTLKPSSKQVAGIASIDPGAARALQLATRAARLEDDAVGK